MDDQSEEKSSEKPNGDSNHRHESKDELNISFGKVGEFFSKIDLYDKIALGVLLVAAIFLFIQVSQFQHIPSPIFGGDFYMARGFTDAILQGRPIYEDPFFGSGYAYYGWLSYLLTAGMVRLTGASLERMSVILPALIQMAYLAAAYLFGRSFFKSKRYGLLFMLVAFSQKIVDMKMSAALALVFSLLALYSFVRFEQGSKKHGWMMGIFMGLTALAHINIFFGLVLLIAISIILEFIVRLWSMHWIKTVVHFVKRYLPAALIAIAIAMLLIGPWIFVYHMQMPNPAQQYSTQDVSKLNLMWVVTQVVNLFFRSGFLQLIFGLVMLIGLVFCVLNRKTLEPKLALFWLVASIIGVGHFLITIPLLHTWSVPGYLWAATAWIVVLVLFVYGVKNIELMFGKSKEGMSTGAKAVFIISILLIGGLFVQGYNDFQNDKWNQYGKQMDAGTSVMFEIGDWMKANTDKNDVFLANDESAFALTAMSGRKVVFVRRTHASYYQDVDQRYADGIVMLFGNDSVETSKLMSQYGVKYVYVDSFLFQYPMIVSKEHADFLKANGVNYTVETVRLDPASADAPEYVALVIPPQNLTFITYNLTVPVKQFTVNNQPYAYMMKVK